MYRTMGADFSGIQTRIVRVEGEHADHLTTATALLHLDATVSFYPSTHNDSVRQLSDQARSKNSFIMGGSPVANLIKPLRS